MNRWLELAQLAAKNPLRVLGLMTGTSMDGLDLCVADVNLEETTPPFVEVFNTTVPFSPDLEKRIRATLTGDVAAVGNLHYDLGQWMAEAVNRVLAANDLTGIELVGCHGQTVYHHSGQATLQLGEPSFLVEVLQAPVVSDFRARDIAVGGTGAPLIPILDRWLFQHPDHARIALNLGGIANVTWLPPAGIETVIGFDTGPGMALLDECYRRHCDGAFDDQGRTAAAGRSREKLVSAWLDDDFIQQPPPKSTGRDRYGERWLSEHHTELDPLPVQDQLATLSHLTAAAVVANCRPFLEKYPVELVIVSGGGVHHKPLMDRLRRLFKPVRVLPSSDLGVDVDRKEALGMAFLAAAFVKGLPGNLHSVTGATRPVILGKLTW
jgi:anhydro-N-acetylmuramic acid kinase